MVKSFTLLVITLLVFGTHDLSAQKWKDAFNKAASVVTGEESTLGEDEVGNGLKEALIIGTKKGVEMISQKDGYFGDEVIKIWLPEEARSVEDKLRKMGLGSQVDDAIESMNRAAEDAAKEATDLFVGAIKEMSITDAMSILKGEQDAATSYLKTKTTASLNEKFEPIIKTSLDKVNATQYWNTVFSSYNKIPFVKKINPELDAYVTEMAIDGLFKKIADQEAEIRSNPGARVTDLLQKVFGSN